MLPTERPRQDQSYGLSDSDGAAQNRARRAERLPTGFVAHGAPLLAVDPERGAPLARWAQQVREPAAFLVVSAHFERAPLTIGTTRSRELLYDFSGFPPALYAVRYPAPGAPELAARVTTLLADFRPVASDRPWDHGVWTPLVHMAPRADVPVLEISMPHTASPAELFRMGGALAPLRDEGVWILGSGNLVHNLHRLDGTGAPPAGWARDFDAWIADVLRRRDWDALVGYREHAPDVELAHPSAEHLRPILVAAGAAAEEEQVSFPTTGWEWGTISRRSVQFG